LFFPYVGRHGRRIYISGDVVPNHYVSLSDGAVTAGQRVEEPGFEYEFADVDKDLLPDGYAAGDGLIYKTLGRWLPYRRVFNEYDFWEGYRNRPIIPRNNNTELHVAGDRFARVWARWILQVSFTYITFIYIIGLFYLHTRSLLIFTYILGLFYLSRKAAKGLSPA
jgi:hypothetical protein